jgi:hypothetical protein
VALAAAAAAAAAAASCQQRGVGGGTNNQQSTKSSDSGNGNGDNDSDDNDNGNEGDGGNLLLPTPPLPPTPRYRQAGRRLRAAAAFPLPLSPSTGRQATTKRAADSAITNHHCLSVSFVGIDGGCEHYLPFHQPHSDNFMPDANHQQIWLIALPVAQPPPICLVPRHPNTMGDTANVRFCQNHRWGRVIGGFCRCN